MLHAQAIVPVQSLKAPQAHIKALLIIFILFQRTSPSNELLV
jgi:hypothetical protein